MTWISRATEAHDAVIRELRKRRCPPAESADLRAKRLEFWLALQQAWAVRVLMAWGLLWYVGSLVLVAPPGLAELGCALIIALTVFGCWRFYDNVWREPGPRMGIVVARDAYVHPFVDALLTVMFVWLLMSTPFVLATSLGDNGSLAASGPELSEQGRFYLAGDLYLWHLFDALPFIQATDTLNWKEPVARYSGLTGTLPVLYKTMVLAPGVVVAHNAWTNRTHTDESETSPKEGHATEASGPTVSSSEAV